MSLYFSKKIANSDTVEGHHMKGQAAYLNRMRAPFKDIMEEFAVNMGRKPSQAYLMFDEQNVVLEPTKMGEHALLMRVLSTSRTASAGKKVYEYVRAGRAGKAEISMSGKTPIGIDETPFDFDGALLPAFATSFGRDWRDKLAMDSEGFDALMIDSQNAERTLYDKMDDYLWNGKSDLKWQGVQWLGIRGDDSVVQTSVTVDLTASATTGATVYAEIKSKVDNLRITQDSSGDHTLVVSREINSKLDDDYSDQYGNKTIRQRVLEIAGIGEIVEDSQLSGNEYAILKISLDGFHSIVGMPISTYPIPRDRHMDDFIFVKWGIVGFASKSSRSGKKVSLFAANGL